MEESRLLKAFILIRQTGASIEAGRVANIARGIKEQSQKGTTTLSDGPLKFSISWANSWMHRNGIRVRRATTTRTVTLLEIVKAAEIFFSELRKISLIGLRKEMVFNADEFQSKMDLGAH